MANQNDLRNCEEFKNINSKIEHLRELMKVHEELDLLRHRSEETARILYASNVDDKFHTYNQWREQLNKERGDYVPRREHDLLAERIKLLEIARGEQTGKAAAYASLAAFIGTAAAI